MRIAVFECEEWERDAFQALAQEHEYSCSKDPLRSDNVGEFADAEIVSPFIYSKLNADVLQKLPQLRLITTRSTGVDHIDRDYCNEHDITVCNVPEYGDHTVAEHVFALLLTISHNMYPAIDRTRKGDFSLAGLRGFDLRDKTMGVIGTGSIGLNVIQIARGFGMNVIAFDVNENADAAERLEFTYATLDDLLEQSDVLTLHVPATPKTKHMLSTDQFARMKPGAVLINTARGSVIDVQALMRALAEGRVAAAGLDVLPEEPTIREEAELLHSVFQRTHDLETLLADHVLLRLRNVYITPHSAFCTREALQRIVDTTVANIRAFCASDPQNVMND